MVDELASFDLTGPLDPTAVGGFLTRSTTRSIAIACVGCTSDTLPRTRSRRCS